MKMLDLGWLMRKNKSVFNMIMILRRGRDGGVFYYIHDIIFINKNVTYCGLEYFKIFMNNQRD